MTDTAATALDNAALKPTPLHAIRRTAASACLPAISISPMWLTSKMPARVRTAMCSAAIPAYSTGISHPAKGTMRAFDAWWRALSGVFLRTFDALETAVPSGMFAVVTKS